MPRKTGRAGGIQRVDDAASMRPRPDAAENRPLAMVALKTSVASMRPRPDAAENGGARSLTTPTTPSFNEAAARCRGKRTSGPSSASFRTSGFNEAAARCRGKLSRKLSNQHQINLGFNEAAARCRGKHSPWFLAVPDAPASMRPRPDAAENGYAAVELIPNDY